MSSDSTIIDWTIVKQGGRSYHFQGPFEPSKILIKTMVAGNLQCIYNCICQWYDTSNLTPIPSKPEEEEEIDLDPEQMTTITHKERNMSQARGDSMLKIIAHRKTLIHKASEQAKITRTVDIGQSYIASDSILDRNSSTFLLFRA